jgi:uncharacterized membrane protein
MGLNWAEHTEEIAAPVEVCFDAIVDYESFPRWQDAVDSVEVMSRTSDGLGEDVRLFVDAKIRKIDYVLRYSYTRPNEIRWDFVEGNGMRDVDGVYTLEAIAPDRTLATYNLGADPELPVPGMILRRTHKQLVKRSVEDLRDEAERRFKAGEEAQTATPDAGERQASAEDHADAEDVPIDEEAERVGSAPPPPPAADWVPKAEREADAREAEGAGPSAGAPRPSRASASDLASELAEEALKTGRAVAEGAVKAGVGVAERAIAAGRDVADDLFRRINRKLDDSEERRRD